MEELDGTSIQGSILNAITELIRDKQPTKISDKPDLFNGDGDALGFPTNSFTCTFIFLLGLHVDYRNVISGEVVPVKVL